jgi:hypothetical protein
LESDIKKFLRHCIRGLHYSNPYNYSLYMTNIFSSA